jgi:hypothetical protein
LACSKARSLSAICCLTLPFAFRAAFSAASCAARFFSAAALSFAARASSSWSCA